MSAQETDLPHPEPDRRRAERLKHVIVQTERALEALRAQLARIEPDGHDVQSSGRKSQRRPSTVPIVDTAPKVPVTSPRIGRPYSGSPISRRKPEHRDLADAFAELTRLLPGSITTTHGVRSRTTRLKANAWYRFDPLDPRRRKDRGRMGRLISWNIEGAVGQLEWSDGTKGDVHLADLVESPSPRTA